MSAISAKFQCISTGRRILQRLLARITIGRRDSDLAGSLHLRRRDSAGVIGASYVLDLSELEAAVRYEGGLSRRLFLAYSASLASIPLFGQMAEGKTQKPKLASDPFSLGVASGDPTSNG